MPLEGSSEEVMTPLCTSSLRLILGAGSREFLRIIVVQNWPRRFLFFFQWRSRCRCLWITYDTPSASCVEVFEVNGRFLRSASQIRRYHMPKKLFIRSAYYFSFLPFCIVNFLSYMTVFELLLTCIHHKRNVQLFLPIMFGSHALPEP